MRSVLILTLETSNLSLLFSFTQILSPGDPEIIPAQPGKIQSPVPTGVQSPVPTFEIDHGLCIIINQMDFYITVESVRL